MSFDLLFKFERELAKFTGAPFVVLTDGCTHAMELCLIHDYVKQCSLTSTTYISIINTLRNLNIKYELIDEDWIGEYQLHGTRIWDSARLLKNNMYRTGQFQCLSFGNGKPLQIGKVGAILTDSFSAYKKLSLMRSDGRDLRISPWETQLSFEEGFHYCPTLEDCEKGLKLLSEANQVPTHKQYPDLRKINFKEIL